MFSYVEVELLNFPRVALQWSCSLLGLRGTIQLHVFNSAWRKFLEVEDALRLRVALVCARLKEV
jgi:hypothetical protein